MTVLHGCRKTILNNTTTSSKLYACIMFVKCNFPIWDPNFCLCIALKCVLYSHFMVTFSYMTSPLLLNLTNIDISVLQSMSHIYSTSNYGT